MLPEKKNGYKMSLVEQLKGLLDNGLGIIGAIDFLKENDKAYSLLPYRFLLNYIPTKVGIQVLRDYGEGYLLLVNNTDEHTNLELICNGMLILRYTWPHGNYSAMVGYLELANKPSGITSGLREALLELRTLGLIKTTGSTWYISAINYWTHIRVIEDDAFATTAPIKIDDVSIKASINAMGTDTTLPCIKYMISTIVNHPDYTPRLTIPSLLNYIPNATEEVAYETAKFKIIVKRIGTVYAYTLWDVIDEVYIMYYRTTINNEYLDPMLRINKSLFTRHLPELRGCLSRLVLLGVLIRREDTFLVPTPRVGTNTYIKLATL